MKRVFASIVVGQLALLASAAESDQSLPQPVDLRQEARLVQKTGKPLVMLFSLPDCAFCTEARRNYLAPLIRDLPEARHPIVRTMQKNGGYYSCCVRRSIGYEDCEFMNKNANR